MLDERTNSEMQNNEANNRGEQYHSCTIFHWIMALGFDQESIAEWIHWIMALVFDQDSIAEWRRTLSKTDLLQIIGPLRGSPNEGKTDKMLR